MGIRLISINIEHSRHLDRVLPFLEHERVDVVCVHELMERDITALESLLGASCIFAPVAKHVRNETGIMGCGIFSRLPVTAHDIKHYIEPKEPLPDFDETTTATKHASRNGPLIIADVEASDGRYRIATTHFTWTPHGDADDFQREDVSKLLDILRTLGSFVVCGDFNAPRGGEIFSQLAGQYTDNIPKEYATSIDVNLHRAGTARPEELADKMVDGLFTTPNYLASDVRLQFDVSDHAAIVATIQRSEV